MPAAKDVVLEVAGRAVTISNPDKVFFPKSGYTKLDLVRYYMAVAEGALRGVAGRPMALKRFVNGAEGEAFFQKRAPTSRPEWIETVELRAPRIATSRWWKEERHGVFLDYNQNAKDRTVASAYSVRPLADARVSTPLVWDEVPTCEAEAFTLATVPRRFADLGDPSKGIDEAVGSLEALLELSAQHEAAGFGDAPWPPHFAKQTGEPSRVQLSRRKREDRPATPKGAVPPPAPGKTVGPTGRRRTTMPLIEIARAASETEARAGLQRWRARHAEVWSHLAPSDLLVDCMRARTTTWTPIRINLRNVPEPERPPQEALEVDYDPWAGSQGPDRSGQLERPKRKRTSPSGA